MLLPCILAGCDDKDTATEPDKDTPVDTNTADTADTADTSCDVTVAAEYPVDGQVDVYHRADIEFRRSAADPTATIAVVGPDSSQATGTVSTSDDERWLRFTPEPPLTPESADTAEITWCGGSALVSFQTSVLGTALGPDVTGRAYSVVVTLGRFVSPEGFSDLLGGSKDRSHRRNHGCNL